MKPRERGTLFLIFVDGVGIPPKSWFPEIPFFGFSQKSFGWKRHRSDPCEPLPLPFGGLIKPIDPKLGVGGIPQSATGQTSLLTGVNAQGVLGYHKSGYPNGMLKGIIDCNGIFVRAKRLKVCCSFINAFRPTFFTGEKRVISVTTYNALTAGLPLHTLEDLCAERSVYQEFTNRFLHKIGYPYVPIWTPSKAGSVLAAQRERFKLILYEHFITDVNGHKGDSELAKETILNLVHFIEAFLDGLNLREDTVILSSDHGNIEDPTRTVHTLNPVPLMAWGKNAQWFVERIESIQDVTLAISEFFTLEKRRIKIGFDKPHKGV